MNPPEYEPTIPEPTPHAYVPDEWTKGATCAVCGFDAGFGLLHRAELVEVSDDPRPEPCSSCPHYAHTGPCPDALPAYPKARPCPCSGEQAAA